MEREKNVQWLDVTQDYVDAALRYALVSEWSDEDDAFVVSVPDFPGLHTHGSTREEAATMGTEAIALNIAGMREGGNAPPAPRFSILRADTQLLDDADRVRAIRKRLNVSQQDFAEMLNVSVGTVRSGEHGTRTPDGASRRLLDISERAPEVLLAAEPSPIRPHG